MTEIPPHALRQLWSLSVERYKNRPKTISGRTLISLQKAFDIGLAKRGQGRSTGLQAGEYAAPQKALSPEKDLSVKVIIYLTNPAYCGMIGV